MVEPLHLGLEASPFHRWMVHVAASFHRFVDADAVAAEASFHCLAKVMVVMVEVGESAKQQDAVFPPRLHNQLELRVVADILVKVVLTEEQTILLLDKKQKKTTLDDFRWCSLSGEFYELLPWKGIPPISSSFSSLFSSLFSSSAS